MSLSLEERLYRRRLKRRRLEAYSKYRTSKQNSRRQKLFWRLVKLKRRLASRQRSYELAQKFGRHVTTAPHSIVSTECDSNGVPWNTYSETSPFIHQLDHDRTGRSTNHFHRLDGYPGTWWRNPSNYSRYEYKASYSPARFEYKDSNGVTRFIEEGLPLQDGGFYGPHLMYGPVLVPTQNLYDRAVTECLTKLQDQKVDIGTTLATAKDTLRLLSSSAADLARLISYVRKGKWGKVHKLFGLTGKPLGAGKSVANRWLEYQFGWKPLMADIHSAHQGLMEGLRKKAFIFSAVRTTKEKVIVERLYNPYSWFPTASGYSDLSCRVKIYAAVSDETVANLSQWGLIDPLSVAWELVPFSFVLDWAYPVGEFLKALHAAEGLTFIGGTVSWRVESSIQATWRRPHPTTSLVCTNFGQAEFKSRAVFRNILTSFPSPNLYSKSPFSTTHLLDAIALIAGAIKR